MIPTADSGIEALIFELAQMCLDTSKDDYSVEEVSRVVEEMFVLLEHEDLTSIIETATKQGVFKLPDAALILGVAEWSGSTGGRDQALTLRSWLRESNDPIRVGLALGQDWFPFATDMEMRAVLKRVVAQFPEFKQRCEYLIAQRGGRD